MSFDDLLNAYLGKCGRFQVLCLVTMFMGGVFVSTNIMEIVFALKQPDFKCVDNETPWNISDVLEQMNVTEKDILLSPPIQGENGVSIVDECVIYDVNISNHWKKQDSASSLWGTWKAKTINGTLGTKPCTKWSYDEVQPDQTLVSKFDMVCDRAWLKGLAKSVQLIGQLFGVFMGGALSDRFGRRPVLRGAFVLSIVFRLTMSLSPKLELYLATRLLSGASDLVFYTTLYVLLTEMINPKWRTLTLCLASTGFTVGQMASPLVGYFLPHWMYMSLANTIVTSLLCIQAFFLPESPRWLYCMCKINEGQEMLRWIAKVNGVTAPPETQHVNEVEVKNPKRTCYSPYLCTSVVFLRLVISMYLWFTVSMLYYGLALNVGSLAGDLYINSFIMGALDIPSSWLILPLVNSKLGRRLVIFFTFLIASITLLADMGFQRTSIVRTVLALVGKLLLNFTFNALYIITPEMFPTSIRNTSIGASSAMARVGSAISPFIAQAPGHIPAAIFGMSAGIATILVLGLPETRLKSYPANVDEMKKNKSLICRCIEK